MTVSDLIEHLQQVSPTALVIAASDDEGNSYKHVSDVSFPYLIEADDWHVETLLSTDDFDSEDEYDEALDNLTEAVILW